MYSLHLTGNHWYLLFVPPGLWILWRQYAGFARGGLSGSRRILFALQAAALILLAASLTGPELRRHEVAFHNPAVLILRDQSASFRAGAYLGAGARYRDFEQALIQAYGARKFDVRVIDFAETAWPVSGFAKAGRPRASVNPEGDVFLTSLGALADFVDSAAIPNLQGAFLFSDGRANLDSGRAAAAWKVPVYPVVVPCDSIAEVQPETALLSFAADGTGGQAGAGARAGRSVDVDVAWLSVGKAAEEVSIRLLQGNKTILARKFSARSFPGRKLPDKPKASPSPDADGGGIVPTGAGEKIRFTWNPDRSALEAGAPLRAVLQPGNPDADFDKYNDTLAVAFPQGRAARDIHVFRPVRSLDEKGMLGILQAWEGTRVTFFGAEDLARLRLTSKDQVWIESASLGAGGLMAWLLASPAKVVVYSRPGSVRNLRVAGLPNPSRHIFTPAAEITVGRQAADAFPVEVARLKSLTPEGMEAPEAAGEAWVELSEDGKRGLLMGRIALGQGKKAFYFGLPALWTTLFDAQGDYGARENIAAYVKAAAMLAQTDDGTVKVTRPLRSYEGVPFDIEVIVPAEGARSGPAVFSVSGGPGYAREWPQADGVKAGAADKAGTIRIKSLRLARGTYLLRLRSGSETLWSDSLEAAPKAALELSRIGFDVPALQDAASRSGGAVLAPPTGGGGSPQVTAMLPRLPAAQIRMETTVSTPLYNTPLQCALILLLLSCSWLLRKKWDLD